MENVKLIYHRFISVFAILIFFSSPNLFAQTDILESCTDFMTCYRDNCDSDNPIPITVDYNTSDDDTVVIIDNYSGHRLFNPMDTDRKYKFCAANLGLCSTSDTDPGEFHIRFKINGTLGGVNRINFVIMNPSTIAFSVSAFQGATEIPQSGTVIAGGRSYTLEDGSTAYDSIKVTSVHSSSIDGSNLFELDQVYFPQAPSSNSDPTDISLSSNTVDENESLGTVVGSLTSTDADAGDTHTYTLVSGNGDTDNSRFDISGVNLVTDEVFNYEVLPNSYSIRIQTDDGNGGTYSKQFVININDVLEPATFTINSISDASENENSSYTSVSPVITGTPIGNISYTLGGADASDFTINGSTGVVQMVARDFENPVDANTDNIYELTITATDDDTNFDDESWTVTVNDVLEPAIFTINSISDASENENSSYTSETPVITGTPIGNISYTLGGADASDFTINGSTGVVQMVARDFENPADANTNNVYEVTITATDEDANFDDESWTVTIIDITESATFTINSISDESVDENVAYDSETPVISGTPTGTLTYTLGGTDASDFTINSSTGVVEMVARDFENPADANVDNNYEVTITATDPDSNFDDESWTVTVTDVIEISSFTIDAISNASVDENTAYTSVTPAITGTPIGDVTYTLGGADAADFTIDESTGVVEMVARDFENPEDENTDNVYEVTITATDDDGNSDDENWLVNINDISSEGLPEVVCVLDLSISMNRDFSDHYTSDVDDWKLAHAKSALMAFTDLLFIFNEDAASLGLARFPNSPQVGCDAGSVKLLQTLDAAYNTELQNDIPLLIADGGSTPLMASLDFAMSMFNSDNNKVIVLLTDGKQNCPYSSNSDAVINAYKATLAAEGITLFTIGLGLNSIVPNDLLSKLTSGTDGGHYNISVFDDKSLAYGDPANPDPWNARTALHAAYANIMVDGLGLNPCTEPLDLIDQGTIKQFEIPINQFDEQVCFFVSWATPQQDYLGVTLKTPGGEEFQLNQIGVETFYRDNHTIISLSEDILEDNGMMGNWILKVDGSNIDNAVEHYQYSVINSSKKLRFETWFDKDRYFIGEEMKIFVELLANDHPVTDLDSIFVKGIGPSTGMGNWLVENLVTKDQMIKVQQKAIEDYLQWDKIQPAFLDLAPDKQKIYLEKRRRSYLKNFDPTHLRALTAKEMLEVEYPIREIIDNLSFNDDGRAGDELAGDGIYTATYKPVREGSYQFYFTAVHTNRENILQREGQGQKFVSVKIDVSRFIKGITAIESKLEKEQLYSVELLLQDEFGNIPSPDALMYVNLSMNKGKLIGNITANPDGTFTQLISLEKNTDPKSVKMTMKVDDRVGKQTLVPSFSKWFYIILGLIIIFFVLFRRRKN